MARQTKAHFLSRFFLAGFTLEGTEDGFLWTTSKKTNRKWRARARELGHVRDLFLVEGYGLDSDAIERAFAAVEADVAPVLSAMIRSKVLPEGKDLDLLLHIIGLNASRPPAEIAEVERHVDENLRRLIVERLTLEQHGRILQAWRAEGRDTSHVDDLDALKSRILAGDVRAVMPREHVLVTGVLGRAALLVDLLGRRHWTLLVAPGGLHFICSDRPVNLLNAINVPPETEARYTDHRFDVIAPMSRQLCLIGHAGGANRTASASERTVAFINQITETGATDYVYSADDERYISAETAFGRDSGEAYGRDVRP